MSSLQEGDLRVSEYEEFFKKKKPEKNDFSIWRKRLDRAVSPSVSVALHFALLAGLSCLVFYRPKPETPKFSIINMAEINLPELKAELPQDNNTQSSADSRLSEQVSSQTSASSASLMQPTTSEPPDSLFQPGKDKSFAVFDGGFMALGEAIAGRGLGGNPFGHRRGARESGIGKREQEVRQAVDNALEWLKRSQGEDGSWGSGVNNNIKKAVSSLAILAFLAHGETPATKKYGECVKQGLKYLLKQSGGFSASGFASSFGEALLTYALAEGATVTQVPELILQSKSRAMLVCRNLEQQGNWSGGTSSAWNYQALKAALFAVSGDELNEAAAKIASVLMRRHATAGEQILRKRDSATVTELDDIFANTYCLQLFGYANQRNTKRYLQSAANVGRSKMLECNWDRPPSWPLYVWYYRSNALFMVSQGRGTDWNRWNNNISGMLVAKQSSDGGFYSPEGDRQNQDGETLKTFKAEKDLTVYSTAMCALILQTRYRYLPSYCAKPRGKDNSQEVFYSSEAEKQTGVAKLFKEMKIKP